MLPTDVSITDDDIVLAEELVLGEGRTFSKEQKAFIKDLTTLDLQAVPGSGKTAALTGKLLALSKALPFDDGSGILVISHTNNAVNNFTDVLRPHCPHLFAYPNFVGTIQSFTDQFLALPQYRAKYGKPPYRIDDATYESSVYPGSARKWLENQPDGDRILKKTRLSVDHQLVYEVLGPPANLRIADATSTYQTLVKMKDRLRQKGILCFDDAYILAFGFLQHHPCIKRIIRKRFPFVFVDEMQDMEYHQCKLLEDVFIDCGSSDNGVYQRIGDKNQAIYTSDVRTDNIWQDRSQVLPLKTSLRLSPSIARAVQPFGLSNAEIVGTANMGDGLKPHVIEYDDRSVTEVIPRFCELLREYKRSGLLPPSLKDPFKAIAWRKDSLTRFFPAYERNDLRYAIHYPNLISYLALSGVKTKKTSSLAEAHHGTVSALMHILFLEGIDLQKLSPDDARGRKSGYRRLTDCLAMYNPALYQEFLLAMYHWSLMIYCGKIAQAHQEISSFVPQLLVSFEGKVEHSLYFIRADTVSTDSTTIPVPPVNVYRTHDELTVNVDTVHSVKGETHAATLYLESSYQGKYETEWLEPGFRGEFRDLGKLKYAKQCTKVVYVGFSRPTHLLCYAIHRNRFKKETFVPNWEVIDDLLK